MNWEAIGAIGEIAGAAGVIITLVYLSLQLRQNTRASQITAIQNAVENSARFSEFLATNTDAAEMFWTGMVDPDQLDLEGRRRLLNTLNVFLRRELLAFYLHKEGTMPKQLWESRVAIMAGTLNQPGLRFYLDAAGDTLPADFLEFVEDLVKDGNVMNEQAKALFAGEESN